MLDAPFRVERSVRLAGSVHITSYAIMRTGEGTLCYCDDAVFAYRVVDLLNADEASKPTPARAGSLTGTGSAG